MNNVRPGAVRAVVEERSGVDAARLQIDVKAGPFQITLRRVFNERNHVLVFTDLMGFVG